MIVVSRVNFYFLFEQILESIEDDDDYTDKSRKA